MKPYLPRHLTDEQIIFNFRASHYQRVSENGSGILESRFRYMLGEKYADTYTYIYQPVIRI